MPPTAVRTLRDLLYWQYAKIIAGSAGIGKENYAFVMERFSKLKNGGIAWNSIREYIKEHEDPAECAYCGLVVPNLTLEHMFPQSLNGPQDEKNAVWACPSCNASKGGKRLYEYWARRGGLRAAKYEVPRIAEGKYLKLLYDVLEQADLLDLDEAGIRRRLCRDCDLSGLCEEEDSVGKLSPLCLDGAATISLSR